MPSVERSAPDVSDRGVSAPGVSAPAPAETAGSPVDAAVGGDGVAEAPGAAPDAGSSIRGESPVPPEDTPSNGDGGRASTDVSPWTPLAPSAAPAAATEGEAPARRARPRRLVAVVAVAALILAASLVAATHTSLFAADAIRVRGIHHLTKGEVLRASGLERGMNVFHLDAAAVEARIERDPWVARATLTKELPGTVILTIRERVPVAVVNDGSVERLVADDGVLLGVGAPSSLPRIVADEGATTTDPAAVRGAAVALSAMRPAIRHQIAFVHLLPDGGLGLELRSGVPVVYGVPDDPAAKAQALAAMLRYADRTGERYTSIDVSVPTAPAGTLIGG